MTGLLANEFAQVREALDTYVDDVCPNQEQLEGYVKGWYAALARIEEHTHNTEKALREIEALESDGGTYDVVWDGVRQWTPKFKVIARAALSAGEGTPA